jgi:hypothetical protein
MGRRSFRLLRKSEIGGQLGLSRKAQSCEGKHWSSEKSFSISCLRLLCLSVRHAFPPHPVEFPHTPPRLPSIRVNVDN